MVVGDVGRGGSGTVPRGSALRVGGSSVAAVVVAVVVPGALRVKRRTKIKRGREGTWSSVPGHTGGKYQNKVQAGYKVSNLPPKRSDGGVRTIANEQALRQRDSRRMMTPKVLSLFPVHAIATILGSNPRVRHIEGRQMNNKVPA